MNAELRTAAERLKAMRKASDEHDGGYPATDDGRWQSMHDHAVLANVLLPELDETPVDANWFASCGAVAVGVSQSGASAAYCLRHSPWGRGRGVSRHCQVALILDTNMVTVNGISSDITTHGEVRTLCRALGIKLKDQP